MYIATETEPPSILEPILKQPARQMLIGGSWIGSQSGESFDVYDPSTGRVIANVPEADSADVDAAVAAAREALDGPWGATLPHVRAELMLRLADLIEENGEQIAALETLNQGKLLSVAQTVEVEMAIDYVRYMAGWATKIEGTTFDLSSRLAEGVRFHAFTRREPVGVVAAIVPWNFPHLMAIWKLAPALATGCTVVLKPAEQTPLTALRLGELIQEAGFPPGVVNVITGHGDRAGAELVRHRGVNKIVFTGSTEVGRKIGIEAAHNMTRTTLELGGKSPVIVLDDIEPEFIAAGMMMGLFFNSGQQCVAGSRLYAPADRFDAIVEKIAYFADTLKLGSPFDPNVHLGPLISEEQRTRVLDYVNSGVSDGAELLMGGTSPDSPGYFVEPTILCGTTHDMRVVREEIFGPVLVAMPYQSLDEAIEKANDTDYGLAASVWTQNISKALEVTSRVKAGTVWVNTHGVLDSNMPFGGFKHSGVGREHGRAAIESYTEAKSVCIAY